jgi:hypothetical protein
MKQRFTLMFLAALLLTGATSKEELRSSLVTVEGTVTGVGSAQGEGDLEALSVTLTPKDGKGKELNLLLAPRSTLDEVEFQVEPGDRIQARVFPTDEGPAKVHKVRNLTRHTMLRLRTLHRIPLWDGAGAWQGGPGRGAMGGQGGHGQHGQGGKGPGR